MATERLDVTTLVTMGYLEETGAPSAVYVAFEHCSVPCGDYTLLFTLLFTSIL